MASSTPMVRLASALATLAVALAGPCPGSQALDDSETACVATLGGW